MSLPTITWKDLVSCKPCYSGESLDQLLKFARTKERWNVFEILACDQYPHMDRLWLVLRPLLIPSVLLHELACRFAEWALQQERNAGSEPDPLTQAVIDAKRSWLKGTLSGPELLEIGLKAADAAIGKGDSVFFTVYYRDAYTAFATAQDIIHAFDGIKAPSEVGNALIAITRKLILEEMSQ